MDDFKIIDRLVKETRNTVASGCVADLVELPEGDAQREQAWSTLLGEVSYELQYALQDSERPMPLLREALRQLRTRRRQGGQDVRHP